MMRSLSTLMLIVALSIGMSSVTQAQNSRPGDPPATIRYTWSVPTARENGQPLAASEIRGYELVLKVNHGEEKRYDIPAGTAEFSAPLELMPSPNANVVEAYVVAIDYAGLSSKPSNKVNQTFMLLPTSSPAAPVNFRLVIECVDCVVKMAQ